jgi:hypothetical protein
MRSEAGDTPIPRKVERRPGPTPSNGAMGGKQVPYGRKRYRVLRRQFISRNRLPLLAVVVGVIALCAVAAVVLDGYVLGLVQGLLAAGSAGALLTLFHAHTGGIWQLAGTWGEDNTRDVLRRARRKRLIWGSVDNIATERGDVDHLVVMRDGRLVALDSKWHATGLDRDRAASDARRAAAAARQASLILRSLHQPRDVAAAVVPWGKHATGAVPQAQIEGVHFVPGHRLLDWLDQNDGADVRRSDARRILRELRVFRAKVRPPLRQQAGAAAR